MLVDLPEPDKNTRSRREQRVEQEERKFDEDHYLADYFDDSETIESQVLAYEPAYKSAEASDLEYSESEVQVLKELPRKRFLLDGEQKFYAYSGLVDILFAYCYTDRINCGESNVEAAWTVSKISSTLSWLDVSDPLNMKWTLYFAELFSGGGKIRGKLLLTGTYVIRD